MYSRGMLTWRIMYSIHASSQAPWTPLVHQISQYPPQDSVFQQPAYITGYSHCLSPVSSLPVSTKGLEKIYRTRASGIQHCGEVGGGGGGSVSGVLIDCLQLSCPVKSHFWTQLKSLTMALNSVFIISASISHPQKTREGLTATGSTRILTSVQ